MVFVAIDCGANIGTHTIEWAKKMTGWGAVIGIEAQERIFYALAGNIAINNCFNALQRYPQPTEQCRARWKLSDLVSKLVVVPPLTIVDKAISQVAYAVALVAFAL
jgi:FkbM family methyltransferase